MESFKVTGTDFEVSALALGCMSLGGTWDDSPATAQVQSRAERAVMTAVERGFNLFDHADIYCRGKSEQVFGDVLRKNPGLRRKIIVQTKCGIRQQDTPVIGSPARYDSSHRHIVDSVEASLRRLQVETIDILLLHRPDALVEPEEVAAAFTRLQTSGKVRHFGVSNHSWAQMKRLQACLDQPLVINQLQLSLGHSDLIWNGVVFNAESGGAGGETLDDACRLRVQVQAWSPLDRGRWTSGLRSSKTRQSKVSEMVFRIATERGTQPESVVLAWLLRHPARIQPVVGTANPDRICACAQADQVRLTREEWYSLLVAARGRPLP